MESTPINQLNTSPSLPFASEPISIQEEKKGFSLKYSFLIFVLVLIIFGLGYFFKQLTIDNELKIFQKAGTQPLGSNQLIINLPLKEDGRIVKRVDGIIYKFNTQIVGINQGSPTTITVTDKDLLPVIEVDKNTQLFLVQNGARKLTRIEDLKPGQQVEILDLYNPKSKKWLLQIINILNNKEASASAK